MHTDCDIQELNLSYLLLIQKLGREDMDRAIEVSGLDADTIEDIRNLSVIQVTRISRCGVLLMQFNGDVNQFRKAMGNSRVDAGMQNIHLTMMQLSKEDR